MDPATQAEWRASTGGLTRPFQSGKRDRSSRSSRSSNPGTRVFVPENTTFPTTSLLTWRSHFPIAAETALPMPGPSNKASTSLPPSPPTSTTFPSGSANPPSPPPPPNPTLTAACPSTTPSTTGTADEYPSPEYTPNPVVPPSNPGRQQTSNPSACATNNSGTENVSNAICIIVSLVFLGDGAKKDRSTTRRDWLSDSTDSAL